MSCCVLICGAPACAKPDIPPSACLICADGGWTHAKRFGLMPDLLIGDFDSLSGDELPSCGVLRFPPEKDDTDAMLAVKWAMERGCTEFLIYGALGGRLDHTIANIQLLYWLLAHGAQGTLIDENNRVSMLSAGMSAVFGKRDGYFSLFAYSQDCRVTLEGVQYPLENHLLSCGFPLGVSNRVTASKAVLSVSEGTVLVMECQEHP